MKGDYEEFYALRRRKNKANSKPNKANPRRLAGNLKQGGWGEIPQFGGLVRIKVANRVAGWGRKGI